jgi:hypothetical protein
MLRAVKLLHEKSHLLNFEFIQLLKGRHMAIGDDEQVAGHDRFVSRDDRGMGAGIDGLGLEHLGIAKGAAALSPAFSRKVELKGQPAKEEKRENPL